MSQGAELRGRSHQFAIRIVRLYQALPKTGEGRTLGLQLLRSGTSVAANYRAACRARTRAEFVSKLGIVQEEADETVFWLDLLVDTGIVRRTRLEPLRKEANELLAIFTASRRTAESARSAFGVRHSALQQEKS